MEKMIDILYVCTGNICRSPVAMILTKHYMDSEKDILILSAGTGTVDGSSISAPMYGLLKKDGIDASDFRSTMINKEIISFSKNIIVMDKTHKRYLNRVSSGKNIYFMKDMVDGKFVGREIFDPFCMDMNYYKKCYDEIKESVLHLIKSNFYNLI